MTNFQLNEYIKKYLQNDKTHSAIMLSAPWGTGKSYYIQNELIPFLRKEENGGYSCIVVSLYGLNSIFEISKALYLESRFRFIPKDSEKVETGKFAVKTVLKGVTSFFGIDLSKSQDEMQKLYDSIDLSGKLLIFEDLERSGISTFEVLGYVNSLVEQDGVRVLLVANEKELKQYEPIEEDNNEKQEATELLDRLSNHIVRRYTEGTKQYLSTKEKTVSDTIVFEGDKLSAIKQILSQFNNMYLSRFSCEEEVKEILQLLEKYDISNLRTLIFACQKSDDILTHINPDIEKDFDFLKTVIYSAIIFSNRIKSGKKVAWIGGKNFSIELSSEEYPLFRFIYDYITKQVIDESKIEEAKETLKKIRLFDKNKSKGDADLLVLYNWQICSEKEVLCAINSITKRLQNENDISLYEYGRLAEYLIAVKTIIGCDIETAKERLINNLNNKGSEMSSDFLYTIVLDSNTDPQIIKEFEDLRVKMKNSLENYDSVFSQFDYHPSSISSLCEYVSNHIGDIYSNASFVSKFNIERIVEMIKNCSSKEIQRFRSVFPQIYKPGVVSDFLPEEKESISHLLDKIGELKSYEIFDKIQNKQLEWFETDLNNALRVL